MFKICLLFYKDVLGTNVMIGHLVGTNEICADERFLNAGWGGANNCLNRRGLHNSSRPRNRQPSIEIPVLPVETRSIEDEARLVVIMGLRVCCWWRLCRRGRVRGLVDMKINGIRR